MNTNRVTSGAAALGARAKDAAAQAVPVAQRAGATAVQGVRQGVQDARGWATPHVEEAVQGAGEWAALRLEEAADVVDATVAPKVSSALRSTARQVRPPAPAKPGVRKLLDWRLLLGFGAALAAAGATAAITMKRRYTSATAEAKDASESGDERAMQAGEPASDAAQSSEANGRVTAPGTGT
jgi:hypothetical protein